MAATGTVATAATGKLLVVLLLRLTAPAVVLASYIESQEGLEELFHIEVRRGSNEEIPLVQGKEQRLCFAGAAVKRYPTSKVRETQVRR